MSSSRINYCIFLNWNIASFLTLTVKIFFATERKSPRILAYCVPVLFILSTLCFSFAVLLSPFQSAVSPWVSCYRLLQSFFVTRVTSWSSVTQQHQLLSSMLLQMWYSFVADCHSVLRYLLYCRFENWCNIPPSNVMLAVTIATLVLRQKTTTSYSKRVP